MTRLGADAIALIVLSSACSDQTSTGGPFRFLIVLSA